MSAFTGYSSELPSRAYRLAVVVCLGASLVAAGGAAVLIPSPGGAPATDLPPRHPSLLPRPLCSPGPLPRPLSPKLPSLPSNLTPRLPRPPSDRPPRPPLPRSTERPPRPLLGPLDEPAETLHAAVQDQRLFTCFKKWWMLSGKWDAFTTLIAGEGAESVCVRCSTVNKARIRNSPGPVDKTCADIAC